jgi:hypothetical protein
MRSYVDRRNVIENLWTLLQNVEREMELTESVKLQTGLLVAYSLVQIEQHLVEMKSGGKSLTP